MLGIIILCSKIQRRFFFIEMKAWEWFVLKNHMTCEFRKDLDIISHHSVDESRDIAQVILLELYEQWHKGAKVLLNAIKIRIN